MSDDTGAEGAAWVEHTGELARSLERHLGALDAWFERWSDLPSTDAPRAGGGWTQREVLEHVVLANRYLLLLAHKLARRCRRRLAAGHCLPPRPVDLAPIDELAKRDLVWPHPEHMTPSGTRSPQALRAELRGQIDATRELARATPEGYGALHSIRMSVIGARLDLYGYLAVIDRHAARHLGQLARLS